MIAPRAVGEPLALYSSCVNSGYCLMYLSENLNLPTENWKLNSLFFFPGPTQAKKTLKLFNLWDFARLGTRSWLRLHRRPKQALLLQIPPPQESFFQTNSRSVELSSSVHDMLEILLVL
jgi:hypothetical protein